MRLVYISAIAFALATPVAAETVAQAGTPPATAAQRHDGHGAAAGQTTSQGGTRPAGPAQQASCCADANNNGRMDCCEGGGCACCAGRGHEGHGQSERPAAPSSR